MYGRICRASESIFAVLVVGGVVENGVCSGRIDDIAVCRGYGGQVLIIRGFDRNWHHSGTGGRILWCGASGHGRDWNGRRRAWSRARRKFAWLLGDWFWQRLGRFGDRCDRRLWYLKSRWWDRRPLEETRRRPRRRVGCCRRVACAGCHGDVRHLLCEDLRVLDWDHR